MATDYSTLERNYLRKIDGDEYINKCTLKKHAQWLARALIKTLNIPEITLQIELMHILCHLHLNQDLHFS
jgi:hypothetical protein